MSSPSRAFLLALALFLGCGPQAEPTCADVAEELCDMSRECRGFESERDQLWDRCYAHVADLCERYSPSDFDMTCEAIESCTWGPVSCE